MCARDPSQIASCGQLKSNEILCQFVSLLSFPACIRDNFGKFIYCNDLFMSVICSPSKCPVEWLSSLPTDLALSVLQAEIHSFSEIDSFHVIEGLSLGGSHWNINIQFFNDDILHHCLWVFFSQDSFQWEKYNGNEGDYSRGLIDRFERCSTEMQWKVYLLHIFGFSHNKISQILSLSVGTSRNIVSSIHKFFSVDTRDELILIAYESGIALSMAREVGGVLGFNI